VREVGKCVHGSQWSLTVAVVAVRRGDGGSESDIGGVVAGVAVVAVVGSE
jgi:hypothetical protein